MLRTRVIPTLLLHDQGLYKTVKYRSKDGKYVGDPINAIKIFNDKGADELIFLDIDASKLKSEPDFDLISKIASECFMPVAYGGGITNLDQIKKIFSIGIEKIILNTVLLKDFELLKKASEIYGSQSVVASVDVKKSLFGTYKVFNSARGASTKLDLVDYLKKLEVNGAGEIYISSVDRDGTFKGYDHELIEKVEHVTNLPLVINGGARGLDDLIEVINKFDISGVSAGSMFVYSGPYRAVLITYPDYRELERKMASE